MMNTCNIQNVLFGHLPETVSIGGTEIPIRTDFRTWLLAGEYLRADMSAERKAANILALCYPKKCSSPGTAFRAALDFYYSGFSHYGSSGKPALYSADFDGRVLYSGFMKCYGIDLSESDMHWHKFAPLMCELNGCIFSEILSVRNMDLSGMNTERSKFFAKQKKRFTLPGTNTDSGFADSLTEVMK